MKKLFTLMCAVLCALNVMAGPQAIIVGHGCKSVNILDFDSKKVIWQVPLVEKLEQACNSVILLKDGKHIAVASECVARVISLKTKKVVWEYKAKENRKIEQIHSVVPLSNGGFSVFIAKEVVEVIEVSPKFKIVKTHKFDALKGGTNPHTMFRSITMAKDGNYLVPWWPEKAVYKMTLDGKVIDKYIIGAGAFAAYETGDGQIIFGSGDVSTVDFYDIKAKKVVKKMDTFKQKKRKMWTQFIAHTQVLGKDKYLISNWTGHNKKHTANKTDFLPVLFICDGKGNISWSYEAEQGVKDGVTLGISGVYYSEKPFLK